MKVEIPHAVYRKLRAYTKGTKYEISGLGKVSYWNGVFTIEDIKIFEQKVSGAETTLDRKALGKFYDQIVQEEGDLSQWKLWWHTHADFGTFFSGTDESTIEDFDNETENQNWILALVTNHNADIQIRLDVFSPLRITLDNLDHEIMFEDDEIEEAIKKEIEEKVQEPGNFLKNLFTDKEDWEEEEKEEKKTKKNGKKKKEEKEEIEIPDFTPAVEPQEEFSWTRWLWEIFFPPGPPKAYG